VGHDLGDQPRSQCLGRRQVTAGQAHPASHPHADFLRQSDTEAPRGHKAYTSVCVGEARTFGGDEDVAVQGQLQPTGDRGAVDCSDHWLTHRRPLRRYILQLIGITEFVEIEACTEHRIGSGENHNVDLVVRLCCG
jgi:hypothetical protein